MRRPDTECRVSEDRVGINSRIRRAGNRRQTGQPNKVGPSYAIRTVHTGCQDWLGNWPKRAR